MNLGSIRTLLTPKEAARVVRRSVKTLETWRREGKGPPFLVVERRIFYYDTDLYEYLERCRRVPRSDEEDDDGS